MLPAFLIPEQVVKQAGEGPVLSLGNEAGTQIQLTLGILQVIEQESLDVAIHGSRDGAEWASKPLAAFPQKFYPGVSSLMLDLSRTPETAYLRASWKVNRWGRGDATPMLSLYLAAERVG